MALIKVFLLLDILTKKVRGPMHSIAKKVIAILFLPVLAYLLAPKDMVPGEYQIKIQQLDGEKASWLIPLSIASKTSEELVSKELTHGLVFEGPQAWSLENRKPLKFTLQLSEPHLDQLSVQLLDGDSRLVSRLRPKKQGSSLVFEKSFLYKADIVLALVVLVAILWITELIPIAAASLLIPIATSIFGLDGLKIVFAQFLIPSYFYFWEVFF